MSGAQRERIPQRPFLWDGPGGLESYGDGDTFGTSRPSDTLTSSKFPTLMLPKLSYALELLESQKLVSHLVPMTSTFVPLPSLSCFLGTRFTHLPTLQAPQASGISDKADQ